MLFCRKCGLHKEDTEFSQKTKVSLAFKKDYGTYCKACRRISSREWRIKNPGKRTTGKIKTLPEEERKWMSAVRVRLSSAKLRSKKFNKTKPTVTDQYLYDLLLKQNKLCALTGAQLVLDKTSPLCLSIDQINPALGYHPENVQWLAWCVNRAKGDLHKDDFIDMCRLIADYALS